MSCPSSLNSNEKFIQCSRFQLLEPWLPGRGVYIGRSNHNLMPHKMQDLYPTYLESSKNFSSHDATVATMIGYSVCVANRAKYTMILTMKHVTGCRCVRLYVNMTMVFELVHYVAEVPFPDSSVSILVVG